MSVRVCAYEYSFFALPLTLAPLTLAPLTLAPLTLAPLTPWNPRLHPIANNLPRLPRHPRPIVIGVRQTGTQTKNGEAQRA